MKVNNLLTDLYKGHWAINLASLGFLYKTAVDIVEGKSLNLNLKAKNLVDYYDNNFDPILADKEGIVNIPSGSTAIINMIGPIITYGDYCTYGADEIVSKLKSLNDNPNIKAILIYMDGPGGAVSAISPFMDFGAKRDKKKPLGVVFEQMCSAHLYIAYGLQPDFVWASNNISAHAGSLGVMLSYINDKKYLEQLGLEKVTIIPDESSDKNKPLLLALEGKYELIKKEMLSPLAIRFQNDMIRLNSKIKNDEPGVMTGKVFYADECVKYGLCDKIGTIDEALEYIEVLTELTQYK